jgi:hypothetical protein
VSSEHRADAQSLEDLVFGAMHLQVGAVGSIVVPTQVQHAVQSVEKQFVFRSNPVLTGLPPGLSDTDHDISLDHVSARVCFQRKRQNVGRPGDAHESFMQLAHTRVADEGHRHVAQRRFEDPVGRLDVSPEKGNAALP